MNKPKIISLLLLIFLAAAFSFAQETNSGGFNLPAYEKFTLDNGLTVYLMEQNRVPLVYVNMVINGGAINDEIPGVAYLAGHSLLFGAGDKTKNQIEELIDYYGAELATGCNLESAVVDATFAAADKQKFFELIADVVAKPVFDQEEIEKYRQRLMAQLTNQREAPNRVIGTFINKMMYGDHPYGNPVLGTPTSLKDITAADIKTFYSKYYHPATSAICVVGDFKTDEMKALLAETVGKWKVDGDPAKGNDLSFETKPFEKSNVLLINKDDSRITTFSIASWGVPFNHEDTVPISLVNTILGGRFTSWLNTELRIKSGLTYGARSNFASNKNAGIFVATSFTANATTEKALDLAIEVFDRLHNEGINAETLQSGKNYIKGNFPRRFESPSALAGLLADFYVYGIDEKYVSEYITKLEAVTPEDVKRTISEHFPKENFQFIVAGQGDSIRELLKKYGEVKEIDIMDDEYLVK